MRLGRRLALLLLLCGQLRAPGEGAAARQASCGLRCPNHARLRGGGESSSSFGAASDESASAGPTRRGKAGQGLGKVGSARRLAASQELPSAQPFEVELALSPGRGAETHAEPHGGAGAEDGASSSAPGGGDIEEEVRAIEREKIARLQTRASRTGSDGRQQGRAMRTPNRGSRRQAPREQKVRNSEALASAPVRTLRQRAVAVNYEEGSESILDEAWAEESSCMSDGQEVAQEGGIQNTAQVQRAAVAPREQVRRTRRKSEAERAANPLGQELSDSGVEGGEAMELKETEETREARRKRRLEEEAQLAAEDALGEHEDADKRYRASRRKLIRDYWGESPEPPPLPAREYTFEEDLAVFRDAERQLRAACQRGDVAEAERLLARGAVMEEWDNCTEDTALTLMRGMRRDAKAKREPRHLRIEISSEDDGRVEDILRDLNLTEHRVLPTVGKEDDGSMARRRGQQGEVAARPAPVMTDSAAHATDRSRPAGAGHIERGGGFESDDDADVEVQAWREGGRWGEGTWGPLPLQKEEDVSLEGEPFLDCQVTGAMRGELFGNERGYSKQERECREFFAKAFPEHRAFRLTDDTDKVGAFTPGEEDCEGVSSSEERLWRDVPELHGWIDPLGRRMQKIEMAVVLNATHTLSKEEQDAIIISQPPCMALQDYMSESQDSHDNKELLVIPKKTTEITRMEMDPFDKLQSKLSTTLGRKEFDFIDALGGFERASAQIGVRGADQTYNQRRARFMNAKKGSYK
jgi:hypothetical protein